MESQPIAFARWIDTTTCGKYVDTMSVQANNTMVKPDYALWVAVYDIIKERGLSLENCREWLGDTILWSELDLKGLA